MSGQICSKILSQADLEAFVSFEGIIREGALGKDARKLYFQIKAIARQKEADFRRLKADYNARRISTEQANDLYQRYLAREILVATQVMRLTAAANDLNNKGTQGSGWSARPMVETINSMPISIYECPSGSGLWGESYQAHAHMTPVVIPAGMSYAPMQSHHISAQLGRFGLGERQAAEFGLDIQRFCVGLEQSRHSNLHKQDFGGNNYVGYVRASLESAAARNSTADYLRSVAELCVLSNIDTVPPIDYARSYNPNTGGRSPVRVSAENQERIHQHMVYSFG
jgi:hypothetical protein